MGRGWWRSDGAGPCRSKASYHGLQGVPKCWSHHVCSFFWEGKSMAFTQVSKSFQRLRTAELTLSLQNEETEVQRGKAVSSRSHRQPENPAHRLPVSGFSTGASCPASGRCVSNTKGLTLPATQARLLHSVAGLEVTLCKMNYEVHQSILLGGLTKYGGI